MSTPSVNIFACGGTGTKTVGRICKDNQIPKDKVNVVYLDTSLSDVTEAGVNIKTDKFFIPDGCDNNGSGKVKTTNAPLIKDAVPEIVNTFGTTSKFDLNIIVCSGASGTGSTYAQFLARHLLEHDLQVIVLIATGDESSRAISNSVSTLASIEAISKNAEKPLTMYPVGYTRHKNNPGYKTYREVEDDLIRVIKKLIFLYTEDHGKADSSDRRNWLRFDLADNRTTGRLNRLFIFTEKAASEVKNLKNIMSVFSLYPSNTEPNLNDIICNYMVDGFSTMIDAGDAQHFIIAEHGISDLGNALKATLDKSNTDTSSRSNREKLGITAETDNDGMVWL